MQNLGGRQSGYKFQHLSVPCDNLQGVAKSAFSFIAFNLLCFSIKRSTYFLLSPKRRKDINVTFLGILLAWYGRFVRLKFSVSVCFCAHCNPWAER